MTKEKVVEKYKTGFCVYGSHPIQTEAWLLDKENTSSNELRFIGYDANMFPMPMWRSFDANNSWHVKRVAQCQLVAKDFKGEVYMDEVCVTEVRP